MPTIAAWMKIDKEHVGQALQQTCEKLDSTDGEVVLDFSVVTRVDATAIKAFEDLAAAADDKAVKVVLRGVNIDIYKVLKLLKLSPRFSFLAQ